MENLGYVARRKSGVRENPREGILGIIITPDQAFLRTLKSLKNLLLRNCLGLKLILCIHVPGISLYKNVVFYSSQIRTLVAMATFSFHRHIMGKVKICYFCYLI